MKTFNDEFYLSDEEKQDALNEDGQELKDEFLFDEKNFSTLIIQSNKGNSKREVLDAEKFLSQYRNIPEKNDLLLWLKKNNFKQLLLEQIQENKSEEALPDLISAYWEAGFTDAKDLLVFVPFLLSSDFRVVLEAYSAILGLDKSFEKSDAEKALQYIQDVYNDLPSETAFMVDEVLEILRSALSETE